MSHKSVKQECLTRALRNSVKQGRPTRVSPQCVNSGCLTSEFAGNVTNKYCLCLSTYVSAFGFVGFIFFFFLVVVVVILLLRTQQTQFGSSSGRLDQALHLADALAAWWRGQDGIGQCSIISTSNNRDICIYMYHINI